MEISFTFDDQLSPAIERALAAATDFTPAMAAVSSVMVTAIDDRFDGEVGPDGQPWKPSQRATQEGGKTLQLKGLRGGLLGLLMGGAGYDGTSAWVGTNVIYAAIHQYGKTDSGSVQGHSRTVSSLFGRDLGTSVKFDVPAHDRQWNTPARPFLGFGEVEQEEIPSIILEHLAAAFEGRAT